MPAPLDPKVAEARIRAKGWIPTVPFPGADKPWPGYCATCKKPGKPKYGNVCSPGSKQGPCRPCSGSEKKTEEEARAVMAIRGLTPKVPYPGNRVPWESTCGNCGGTTSPTLSSVRKAIKQGQPKCCDTCRRNGPIGPEQAVDLLRLAGAEPLVPYSKVKTPWRARCLNENCRAEIKPTLDNIKHAGTGACLNCGAFGIKADDDALVYLMVHPTLAAAKIGIAKVGSRRIALHESTGWTLLTTIFMSGRQARAVERHVLSNWSALGLPYGVHPSAMPYAGYTETVSLDARRLDDVREDFDQALRDLAPERAARANQPSSLEVT
ncbi:hypothetical protein SAMN05421811_104249 [Nonomuraea wenchangensis]|uniref:Uncharacterized protein n=1 Tax=Nonomuraea wenchangensis TaxID=568860 RepID=A0A1I0HFA8_9ACTN|nr:hypothetical protein SAMN05421811_104249 [Nonomuraea wenchangensis]